MKRYIRSAATTKRYVTVPYSTEVLESRAEIADKMKHIIQEFYGRYDLCFSEAYKKDVAQEVNAHQGDLKEILNKLADRIELRDTLAGKRYCLDTGDIDVIYLAYAVINRKTKKMQVSNQPESVVFFSLGSDDYKRKAAESEFKGKLIKTVRVQLQSEDIDSDSVFDSVEDVSSVIDRAVAAVNDSDPNWELDNPDDFADAVFDWLEKDGYELTDEIVDKVWEFVDEIDFSEGE